MAARTPARCDADVTALPDVAIARGDSASLSDVPPLTVLYRDSDFLAVDKPADVRMDGAEFAVTMERLIAARYGDPESLRWRHTHQLDYATSGVLLYASSAAAAAAATLAFSERRTGKTYAALVEGHVGAGGTLPLGVRRASPAEVASGSIDGGVAVSAPAGRGTPLAPWKEKMREHLAAGTTGVVPPRNPPYWFSVLPALVAPGEAPGASSSSDGTVGGELRRSSWSQVRDLARAVRAASGGGDAVIGGGGCNDSCACAAAEATTAASNGHPPSVPPSCKVCDPTVSLLASGVCSTNGEVPPLHALSLSQAPVSWPLTVFVACMDASRADARRFQRDRDRATRAPVLAVSASGLLALPVDCGAASEGKCQPASTCAPLEEKLSSADPALPASAFVVELPIAELGEGEFRMAIGACAAFPAAPPGRPAQTLVRVLQWGVYEGRPVSRVALSPVSGRRHQLRLHLAALGHPIVGDGTYSAGGGRSYAAEAAAAPRMMLAAAALRVELSFILNLPLRTNKPARRWAEARRALGHPLALDLSVPSDPFSNLMK